MNTLCVVTVLNFTVKCLSSICKFDRGEVCEKCMLSQLQSEGRWR